MEGLGATVDERDICGGTRALMSRMGLAGGEFGLRECARSAGDQGGNCSHDFLALRLSPGAAEEGWLVEQRGLVAWEIRALNFLDSL